MALEDMTGATKFLNAFNPSWPDGDTDPKQQGDDHIRGVKNVLLNTFGALAASVAAWMQRNAGGLTITNLAPGVAATDAANVSQAQSAWDKNARSGKIINLAIGTAASDAATLSQAQTAWNKDAGAGKIVNLAVGTAANDAVNRSQLDGAVGFQSPDVAIATTYAVAHGLATPPRRVELVLVCATAQHGYAVGDFINLGMDFSGSSGGSYFGYQPWANATQCGFAKAAPGIVCPKGGGQGVQITEANWRLRVLCS